MTVQCEFYGVKSARSNHSKLVFLPQCFNAVLFINFDSIHLSLYAGISFLLTISVHPFFFTCNFSNE